MSDCGRYLITRTQQDCRDNLVYFTDLEALSGPIAGPLPLTQIIYKLENDYEVSLYSSFKSKYETTNFSEYVLYPKFKVLVARNLKTFRIIDVFKGSHSHE